MAITLATGEALTGEGNELAHIDLLIGSKNGPVGTAFATAFTRRVTPT
jgi:5,6,7,8-tetrahydromethanopterin hydro-lyase